MFFFFLIHQLHSTIICIRKLRHRAAAVVIGFVPARREDYVIRLTVSYRGEETIPLKA